MQWKDSHRRGFPRACCLPSGDVHKRLRSKNRLWNFPVITQLIMHAFEWDDVHAVSASMGQPTAWFVDINVGTVSEPLKASKLVTAKKAWPLIFQPY